MVSVTQVLAPYADFSGIPVAVLEHAAARGTRVHAACAAYAQGLFVVPLEADAKPYFQSFRRWFDYTIDEVVAVEKELIHPFGFVGHPDLIVKIRGDKHPSVVDLKTPAAVNKLWRAQLAAYVNCANKNGIPAKRGMSLRLKKDGSFPIVNEYNPAAEDWAAFLNAFYSHQYFMGGKKSC